MKSNHPNILSYRLQILESEQEVDRTRKTAGFDASLSASVGFNQAGYAFREAYDNLSRQDIARVSITIPVMDWGIRKGRVNMAKNNLNVTRLTVEQGEQDLEQEVIATIDEFNKQQRLILKSATALDMAVAAYSINKQRFIVGKVDISALTLSLNRRKEAQRNYISALSNYWKCYYAIRKMTLFDFEKYETLDEQFDRLLE
jgi:outer membrane protein TolC